MHIPSTEIQVVLTPPRRVAGFTLMELLVSVSVLVVIIGLVYASFSSVSTTMELARDNAERLRFRQIVWRNLSVNLQGVYADAACLQPEYQFLGESGEGPYGPADTLRFATSLPMPGARALPGVSKIVTYELVDHASAPAEVIAALPQDDERPGSILLIHEEPLQLESTDFVARVSDAAWDTYQRAIPVASMDILYYDGLQGEWIEQWDSIEERRLPGGVRVKINFPRSEEERIEAGRAGINLLESPDLDLIMALPLGRDVEFPFPDFNHLRFQNDEVL